MATRTFPNLDVVKEAQELWLRSTEAAVELGFDVAAKALEQQRAYAQRLTEIVASASKLA